MFAISPDRFCQISRAVVCFANQGQFLMNTHVVCHLARSSIHPIVEVVLIVNMHWYASSQPAYLSTHPILFGERVVAMGTMNGDVCIYILRSIYYAAQQKRTSRLMFNSAHLDSFASIHTSEWEDTC